MRRGCVNRMGWCQGRFSRHGYRMTLARQAILEVLSKSDAHLSIDEIYHNVHLINPSVGVATVYRTLELLNNLGIVAKFDFGDRKARYELAFESDKEKHHHHLVCTSCGKIINYTDFIDEEIELLKKTEKGLSKKYNFKINKHIIQFYGICEKCGGGD